MSRVAIVMPVLGFEQDTGRIVGWFRQVGDRIERGDPIGEIDTEKVTVALESPYAGTLVEIAAAVGTDVPVGDPVAWLDDGA